MSYICVIYEISCVRKCVVLQFYYLFACAQQADGDLLGKTLARLQTSEIEQIRQEHRQSIGSGNKRILEIWETRRYGEYTVYTLIKCLADLDCRETVKNILKNHGHDIDANIWDFLFCFLLLLPFFFFRSDSSVWVGPCRPCWKFGNCTFNFVE